MRRLIGYALPASTSGCAILDPFGIDLTGMPVTHANGVKIGVVVAYRVAECGAGHVECLIDCTTLEGKDVELGVSGGRLKHLSVEIDYSASFDASGDNLVESWSPQVVRVIEDRDDFQCIIESLGMEEEEVFDASEDFKRQRAGPE